MSGWSWYDFRPLLNICCFTHSWNPVNVFFLTRRPYLYYYHNNIYTDLCSVSLMIFIVLTHLWASSHPPIWPQSWQQQRHWLVLPLWPQWPHCISVSFIYVELHSYCWGNSSIQVQHVFQTCYTAGWMTRFAVELVKKHFALYNTHGLHYFWFPTSRMTMTNAVKL